MISFLLPSVKIRPGCYNAAAERASMCAERFRLK
nr:MAG TPA: hypothetical protein [Caudoviricetes sp.]